MCATICGKSVPNEGAVQNKGIKNNTLRWLNLEQMSRKVDVQMSCHNMAGMIFQTCFNSSMFHCQ